jgi:hypothetical protein
MAAAAIRSTFIFAATSATVSPGERHPFVPSHEPWDWGGGWWAGYHYCGGWTYQYGYAPHSCYIFGGG